ncbi:MAG: hypothetical protein IT314_17865 [Anaerolineales bacterium]|nr:hypothetical protein [Anaerolineales bacterium]
MPTIEEQYLDVLQNIESAIISVYHEHTDLLDYEVDKVLSLLWTEYRNENAQSKKAAPLLNANAQLVYERVKSMCEWRLGRKDFVRGEKSVPVKPEPISVDVIMDCLKRIRKSVALWTKEGGRQGYLYFIDNNM